MKTFGTALLGAGRMGREHAKNLAGLPAARVVAVADPDPEAAAAAQRLARAERTYPEPEAAILDPAVEVVVIATPTPTHAPLIEAAAQAGKAIFCEKPIALELAQTRRVLEAVRTAGVPFQIGFQRRYDPGYATARDQIDDGVIGEIEQFRAVGRDPAPPPLEYLKASGGLFLDQAIHEFDTARFLVGEVLEVQSWGAVRVDPRIAELGDVDTAVTLLRFANGALGVIENSRRAVYGYDIRVEVFGERGKLVIEALPKTPLYHFREGGYHADHYFFFMDRFKEAYRLELEAFFHAIAAGHPPAPGPKDAIEALRIGLAATKSLKEGRPVRMEEIQ